MSTPYQQMPFRHNSLTMESISWQRPECFRELVALFGRTKKNPTPAVLSDTRVEYNSIVMHHTGMDVRLNIDEGSTGAYVVIPELTNNHPLFSDHTFKLANNDGLDMIRKAKKPLSGWVNPSDGTVGGCFSQIPINVHLPKEMFTAPLFSVEEVAAVSSHENGHGYTFFEYLARTCTTNQILAGMDKAMSNADSQKQREIILMEVAKSVGLKDVDVEELSKTTDSRIRNAVIINGMNRAYASQVGYNIYDRTAGEALADQWATRMGAGRHLVTGLDKLYKNYHNIEYRTTMGYLTLEVLKIAFTVGSVAAFAVAPQLFSAGILLGNLALIFTLMDVQEFGEAGRYDTPSARFTRIKHELTGKLRNKSLSVEENQAILADIDAIDAILSDMTERRQFYTFIADIATTKSRAARDLKIFQKDLEVLANNELLTSSARLTVASTQIKR